VTVTTATTATRTPVEVLGFRELERSLTALGPIVAVREMRGAVRVGVRAIRVRARENLESHGLARSGALARRLIARVQTRSRQLSIVGQVFPARRTFYGMFAEFGTVHQPPTPWLRPAADDVGPSIPAMMVAQLRRRLAKIAADARHG